MSERLFVYGTLLPGERNKHYLRGCEGLGAIQTAAEFTLHALSTFPALVSGGSSRVHGRLVRVTASRLDWLDRLEESPEYYRRVEVALHDDSTAWAYVLPQDRLPAEAVVIPHGDWCAWSRAHPTGVRLTHVRDLQSRGTWRPIRDCPGRRVLSGGTDAGTPQDLLGEHAVVRTFRVPAAPDPVWVSLLPDGGLISFERPDGSFVHTLNTPEGFARKLRQLQIGF